jgi:hypothetical protein
MTKPRKKQPTEIRFSPLSLLCLLFCWVAVCGLAFYLGILVGRVDQMREVRRVYGDDERGGTEEELPYLSFAEDLVLPEEEQAGEAAAGAEPVTETPASRGSAERMATDARILQVASFREPEHAEHLVRELRKKGYRCFRSLPDPSGPGDAYCRVFVGPLSSQESALQMKARLEEEEGYQGILIRSAGKKEAVF